MKKNFLILFVLFMAAFVPHCLQAQTQAADIFRQEGIASWYGREFEGRPTASGEIFDSSKLTAAHPNLPFGTMLVVTNQHNNKKITVRVNDRGPFVAARIIDVSRAAAEQLDMIVTGTAPVLVESVDRIVVSSPTAAPGRTPPPVVETPQVSTQTVPQIAPQTAPQVYPAHTPVQTPVVQPPITHTLSAAVNAPPPASSNIQPAAEVYVSPPAAAQASSQIKLTPEINIVQSKIYRLQIGSYKVARNAVDAFERLKNAGLNPAYERYTDSAGGEYFRVVLAGVRGTDVQLTTEKLKYSGFREALIREEN